MALTEKTPIVTNGVPVNGIQHMKDTLLGIDANLDMSDLPIIDVGYMDFNLLNGVTHQEGRLHWNPDDGTLNVGLKGGNVNLQVGLEQVIRGKNVSGSGTTNGKPARISGASGSNPEFSFADADDPVAMESVGIFTEDIVTNGNGYVTTFGLVRDMNTSGSLYSETWNDADRIFVGNTSGSLTNVLPSAGERKIFMGIVMRAHATEGVLWVSPDNLKYMGELSGNLFTTEATNDQVQFTGTNWVNINPTDRDGIMGLLTRDHSTTTLSPTNANDSFKTLSKVTTPAVHSLDDLSIVCATEKTLVLDKVVWDDYVTALGANNWNGVSNNPVLTKLFDDGSASQGVYGFVFSDGDEALITVQLPHKWKEGTAICPHIHFMCTSDVSPADNFGIEFEYIWSDIGEDFPANSTLETVDISTGVNTDNMHQYGEVAAASISGTGHTISSVLLCRIKRVAATSDNYAGGIVIMDFDIHYQVDTMGSRQEGVK